jgi:hypothetical protein
MTDQQILIEAIEKAGVVIAEHIEPGHTRDPEQTISRLIAVLDTQDVARRGRSDEGGIRVEGGDKSTIETARWRSFCLCAGPRPAIVPPQNDAESITRFDQELAPAFATDVRSSFRSVVSIIRWDVSAAESVGVLMIRTFWLAVICLVGLGVMVATRIETASLASADASRIATSAQAIEQNHALMKSDKLEVLKIEPSPVNTMVTPVATAPAKNMSESPEPNTKIVSRHWHDPLAPISKLDTNLLKSKSKKTATAR